MVVVWAEDTCTDRTLIQAALADAGSIHFVGDGAEALQAIEAHAPRSVVLDVHMPLMDGVAALRRIREHPRLRDLPVVMFSSARDREAECRALGVTDFVEKPMQHERFVAAVRHVERLVSGLVPAR